MEITILSIGDRGDLGNERIGLKVLKECDLKYYILFSTNLTENSFYNRSKASYWFAPLKVKAQDKIVVYTKKGSDSIKSNEDGSTTYFFYWGLENPLFNEPKNGVVVGELKTWENSRGK
jgi:hypothetical protein